MNIGDYNIRTFVITLESESDQERPFAKHLAERGIDYECFYGINGEVSGLRTVHTYEVDHPGTNYRISHKTIGIWLSHYMIWKAINLQTDSHFLVLESDVRFPENWRERMEAAMRDVPPDFDMLYIGSCCAETAKHKEHIAGEIWDARYPLCTHAILIAKKALPVILRTQMKVYAPIDISLTFHSHPQLKVYTVLPRIAEQAVTVPP